MKIGIASDLHIDSEFPGQEFFDWRGDVLLLAGDIANGPNAHDAPFWDSVVQMADKVYMVTGNHEYYRTKLDTADQALESFLTSYPNVTLLQNGAVDLDDNHVLFGSTFWTNFDNNPQSEMEALGGMRDFQVIRTGEPDRPIYPSDLVRANAHAKIVLHETIKSHKDKNIICMTHHAPSTRSIAPRFQLAGPINFAFVNRLDDYIEFQPNLKFWIHGHTHDTFDYSIAQCRVIANPKGYRGERPAHLPAYVPITLEL